MTQTKKNVFIGVLTGTLVGFVHGGRKSRELADIGNLCYVSGCIPFTRFEIGSGLAEYYSKDKADEGSGEDSDEYVFLCFCHNHFFL